MQGINCLASNFDGSERYFFGGIFFVFGGIFLPVLFLPVLFLPVFFPNIFCHRAQRAPIRVYHKRLFLILLVRVRVQDNQEGKKNQIIDE